MSYRELVPHPALRPFVDRFWTSATEAAAQPRTILPDGCIDLLVDLEQARAFVVGAMTRPLLIAPRRARSMAVRFRPGGAAPFLRAPAHALTDLQIDWIQLDLRWLPVARLLGEADLGAAVRRLERALLERLSVVAPPEPLVAYAVRTLFSADPPSIEGIARRIGWSRQHFRRVLRDHVGVGPKELARVARLQRAVDGLQGAAYSSLAEAAAGLGYFDQAHMARDLRQLAGMTPSAARASRGSIFPIRSLLEAP